MINIMINDIFIKLIYSPSTFFEGLSFQCMPAHLLKQYYAC